MYVGYILDKESGMYHQGPVRRSSINLPPQNFVSTPQYPDFTGYHHVPNMDTHAQSAGSWGSSYGAPREDWGAYSLGPPNTIPAPMSNSSPGQVPYCSPEYSHMHPPGSAALQPPPENVSVAQLSPDRERLSFQWMNKTAQSSSTGKFFTFLALLPESCECGRRSGVDSILMDSCCNEKVFYALDFQVCSKWILEQKRGAGPPKVRLIVTHANDGNHFNSAFKMRVWWFSG